MKTIHTLTRKAGRIAVHIGAVLALASAVVIVANAPALAPTVKAAKPDAEVIRLEPVQVTISSQRFDEIRAEINGPLRLVRETSRRRDEV